MHIGDNLTDEELFSLLSQHEEHRAFRLLYLRYWDRLLALAYKKLQDTEEAEEVVQEVFTNLWRRRKSTKLKHTFNTYISASVKYEIFSCFAKRNKKNQLTEYIQTIGYSVNSVERWIDYKDVLSTIQNTVSNLPEKCRLVFQLSREEGYTQQEIAKELEISTKTVESHMTKALKAIRISLHLLILLCLV
ncbi:RNA polymerase sigma-70 factor [Sphingobacterium bambusae]|uniref:RNA polymerase sigma-70 factor n=1 Tax=Sphingobacterium bambusae TaxID=662858 RepID=A0ABW6BJL2_9SPHI|nr:RNA polymerase sigma-70 factor [Sphingobacterium bambusae]WPL49438.1 RNA polymerase sigma-70 factor [Sphingobacterium bambusae]